jgi:hypothetical protein
VLAFNTAEGWSWDVSVDIAREVLQRALDADENPGEDTECFIDPHVADRANAVPRTATSPADLVDALRPDFEKRLAAPSVWAGGKRTCGGRKAPGARARSDP